MQMLHSTGNLAVLIIKIDSITCQWIYLIVSPKLLHWVYMQGRYPAQPLAPTHLRSTADSLVLCFPVITTELVTNSLAPLFHRLEDQGSNEVIIVSCLRCQAGGQEPQRPSSPHCPSTALSVVLLYILPVWLLVLLKVHLHFSVKSTAHF